MSSTPRRLRRRATRPKVGIATNAAPGTVTATASSTRRSSAPATGCASSGLARLLAVTAAAQAAIYGATGSVALVTDLVHNAGDAPTAVPLAAAFLLRSDRAERGAGLAVVRGRGHH